MEAELRESSFIHILHITRFASWLEEAGCAWQGSYPYLLTMGGTDIHVELSEQRKEDLSPTVRRVLDEAGAITLFTPAAKEVLIGINPAWEAKVKVISEGIILPPVTEVNPVLSWEEAISKGYRILLPAGLRPVKDVLHLIEAWQRLAMCIPGLRVTLIGESYDETVYREVKEAEKEHPFFTYHAPVPFEEMADFYRKADLVVNSSKQEGQSHAVCEALGLGLPVIARLNPGNQSLIRQGVTGYLYEQPELFPYYVDRWLSDPLRSQQMLQQAKEEIKQRFEVEREIDAYLDLHLQICTSCL